jgi:hypothetical protein
LKWLTFRQLAGRNTLHGMDVVELDRCARRALLAILMSALLGCGGNPDPQPAAMATAAAETAADPASPIAQSELRFPVPADEENVDDGVIEAARAFAIRLVTPAFKAAGPAEFPEDAIRFERLAFMHVSTGGKMEHWLVDGNVTAKNGGKRLSQWRVLIARLDDSFIPVMASLDGVEIYHLRSHPQLLVDVREAEIKNRESQAAAAKAEELAAKRAVWKEIDATRPAEQKAEAALKLAVSLLDAGRIEPARKRLHDVIEKFPDTRAAAEAAELLEKPPAESTD